MKWPKILHLPNSQSVTDDDKVLENVDYFKRKEVVITEKLENK